MAGLALACTSERETTRGEVGIRDPARPNLVIFLTDTVRTDRVGAYGCRRNTTPFFDRFACRSFLFTNAYAPCSWTRPSVASLFTGKNPQRHGVQARQSVLPATMDALADLLQRKGWHTAIVNTNPHVTEDWGMTRGFGQAVHIMPHPDHMKAGNGANVVLRHVRRLAQSLPEPYFLYVHLIDPHYPYEPPDADLEAIGVDPTKAGIKARYDAEIHFADRHLEDMMGVLDTAGLLENTIVVMTADHGEEIYDHGNLSHGKTLYQEVMKIPLAIGMGPGMRQRLVAAGDSRTTCPRIDTPVSLVDLMPTLLGFLGQPVPENLDGIDIAPLLRCEELPRRPLYFSVNKEKASLAGILVENTKLIVDRATGKRELYQLATDPTERAPIRDPDPGMAALEQHLVDLIESYEASARPGYHLELASKDREQDKRHVWVRLTTVGKFVEVVGRGFEPGDHWELSKDARTIELDVQIASQWQRRPIDVWAQDRDELTFEVEPPNALINVMAKLEGHAPRTAFLRFPPSIRTEWPITISRRRARSHLGTVLLDRRLAGLYIFVREAEAKVENTVVSAEVEAALRALGYLH